MRMIIKEYDNEFMFNVSHCESITTSLFYDLELTDLDKVHKTLIKWKNEQLRWNRLGDSPDQILNAAECKEGARIISYISNKACESSAKEGRSGALKTIYFDDFFLSTTIYQTMVKMKKVFKDLLIDLEDVKEANYHFPNTNLKAVASGCCIKFLSDNRFFNPQPRPSKIEVKETDELNFAQNINSFPDSYLKVKDEQFPVHRFKLANRSPFFHRMFTSGMKGSEQNAIIDFEQFVQSPLVLSGCLEFIYYGKILITNDHNFRFWVELYKLAHLVLIDDLRFLCHEHLAKNINGETFLSVGFLTKEYGDSFLLKLFQWFIEITPSLYDDLQFEGCDLLDYLKIIELAIPLNVVNFDPLDIYKRNNRVFKFFNFLIGKLEVVDQNDLSAIATCKEKFSKEQGIDSSIYMQLNKIYESNKNRVFLESLKE